MNKEDVLDRAKHLISNDRIKHYGPPKENFARLAKLWSVVIGTDITAAQVAICLAQLKIARLIETPDHEDSWIDLAGYAACGGEVAEPRKLPTSITPRIHDRLSAAVVRTKEDDYTSSPGIGPGVFPAWITEGQQIGSQRNT